MPRFSQAAKVGTFTVVTVTAGYFIHDFLTRGTSGDDGYTVHALLDDASGIVKHSHVRIAGIPVGSIEKISLEGSKARVDIRVNDEVPLYEDASVAKVSSSLLGDYSLRLSQGTEGKIRLKDGEEIRVENEGVTTDDILLQVSEIAKDLKEVSESLARTVGSDQGEEDMRETLENLSEVTRELNETVKENRETVRSILVNINNMTAKSAPEVEKILENVRVTTEEVRQIVGKAEDPDTPASELREIVSKVNRASDDMEAALDDIETVTGRLEKGEGTLGRLSKDEKLINEVEGIAEGIGEFVGGLNRLRTVVSLRSDYNMLASSVKSYVEVRLQPREDKYYSLELISDPRGSVFVEQLDVTTTNPNDPPQYRETRTRTTDAFRFSLQFAQRMGPFVGRFGIKESTGGIGLDTLLFKDRFELRQDLFAFGEAPVPRYRVFMGYEFLNRLWLLGGADDVISSSRRDYFLGLQLRFDDRDLKNILPFAGGSL
jgi:phospholipid/cholesterol/gamma-HCH transport system substrate-binding protein